MCFSGNCVSPEIVFLRISFIFPQVSLHLVGQLAWRGGGRWVRVGRGDGAGQGGGGGGGREDVLPAYSCLQVLVLVIQCLSPPDMCHGCYLQVSSLACTGRDMGATRPRRSLVLTFVSRCNLLVDFSVIGIQF